MELDSAVWNKNNYQEYIRYLESLGEEKYRDFNKRIISTKYVMLGIRIPLLRKIAKAIYKGDYLSFLGVRGTPYFEEVLIKGLVIGCITDLEVFNKYFYDYLLLIDNWAINDSFCNSLKIVNKNKDYFMNVIDDLVSSDMEYKVRVGLIILLNFYVSKEYLEWIFKILDSIKSDLYYVNMAEAWLLCEVFTKYREEALKYLEKNKLNKFTINKAISKIRDSYRVDKEMKDYILKFRRN